MPANIYFIPPTPAVTQFSPDYAIIDIDGRQAKTLRQFYEQIARVLNFPDYFGFTLDSLDELLNDLDWIEDGQIALRFTYTDELISQERDPEKLASLLNLLDATAEDWKWVDDEDDVAQKKLVLLFDDSIRIRQLLDSESINYVDLRN